MAEINTHQEKLESANRRTLLGAGVEALGQIGTGVAAYRSATLRSTILKQNAESKRVAAEDAIIRGRREAGEERVKTAQTIGAQRAALAANGIVVDEDTALDLITDTAGIGALDALTALKNAEKEAAKLIRAAELDIVEAKVEKGIGRAEAFGALGRAGRTILGATRTIEETRRRHERGEK